MAEGGGGPFFFLFDEGAICPAREVCCRPFFSSLSLLCLAFTQYFFVLSPAFGEGNEGGTY